MAALFTALVVLYIFVFVGLLIYLARLAFDGEFSASDIVTYACIYLSFGGLAYATKATSVGPALLLIAVGAAIAYPVLRWAQERIALQRMMLEDLQKYLTSIENHPELPYAYAKVGDIYFGREQWDKALAYYEKHDELEHDDAMKYRIKRCRESIARLGLTPQPEEAAQKTQIGSKDGDTQASDTALPWDDKARARAMTASRFNSTRDAQDNGASARGSSSDGSNDDKA